MRSCNHGINKEINRYKFATDLLQGKENVLLYSHENKNSFPIDFVHVAPSNFDHLFLLELPTLHAAFR